VNCDCHAIIVDQNNHRFSIDRYFIVDKIENRLVRYFGDSVRIIIWKKVEIFGKSCFASSKLESITFESESRLTRIGHSCFSNCSLKSIIIPRNVEILPKSCFARSQMKSITFESESRLTRIEDSCFSYCLLEDVDYLVDISAILRSLDVFERVGELVAVQLPRITVAIRFDVERRNIEMPSELKSLYPERLHFHTSAKVLVVPDWIEIISAKDFRCCPALQAVVIDRNNRLKEVHGFRDCPLLESIELRASVEVIGRDALTRSALGQHAVVHPVFIIAMNESYFRRSRQRCHLFL
jgi:hypothetical protein